MAGTEDVIELGSSDEEAEPAPKKVMPRKNKPNAMVHIPQGMKIMGGPKPNISINPIKKLLGKGVTVTKVNKPRGVTGTKLNIKPIDCNNRSGPQKLNPPLPVRNGKTVLPKSTRIPVLGVPVRIHNVRHINPNTEISPVGRSTFINATAVSQVNNTLNISNVARNRAMFVPLPDNNIRPKLPSNTTVQKTTLAKKNVGNKISAAKRPAPTNTANVNKKRKMANVQCGEVMTVDLEDDETPESSTAGPQWYIRPEEADCKDTSKETDNESPDASEKASSNPKITIEQKNNSEPTKFIEITIEDSPIKPVANKRTHEIGAELPITIDDSPVKPRPTTTRPTTSPSSDNDSQETEKPSKQSKKKLNYPKETYTTNTIEIELEPINSEELEEDTEEAQNNEENLSKNKEVEIIIPDNVIEVMESPAKAITTPPTTPKKDQGVTHTRLKPIQISDNKETGEFHPVYQEFIDLCIKIENSNDMQTIIEKKIKNYYKQVPNDYTESEEFLEMVQSKIMAMKAGPEKLYLYIKDVVDELNLQRKMAKAKPVDKETRNLEAEKFQYGEESEFDPKRQRQIRKLEKTLKKLHRAIQKLEDQEVDFDDEEDSVYLLTERYKERMVRVHAKFCQLTNTKMPSEPRIQIDPRLGQPKGPAKRLEKWVNKRVPIGTPLPFPDFHDVLRCVREANDQDKLGWNEADIMEEARDLFTRCGKKLQRRRQENEWRLAASRIPFDVDPAENNDDLKKKLDTNKQLAAKKETDVFNKYADKQSQLKLEAVEIGDKEAEESPAEEEDDDDDVEEVQIVEDSLGDKERRKERIRKLLKSKNKKTDKSDGEKNSPKDDETSTQTVSKDVAENENNASAIKNDSVNNAMDVDFSPEEINKDSMEVDQSNLDKSNKSKDQSSDEHKVDSDMDELHLLQKLHSDEINSSTADTTDSESAIDISDTLSSGDNKKPSSDVISIENSSYSESEDKNEGSPKDKKKDVDNDLITEVPEEKISKTLKIDKGDRLSREIECTSSGVQINKSTNDEHNESVESILLETSDEEDDKNKNESPKSNDDCVNLKDDAISIGETTVQDTMEEKATDIVVESSPKTIEESPENIIDSDEAKSMESLTAEDNDSATKEPKDTIDTDDTKITGIVVESPPKTIEDSPENIIDSDEAKSMESLTAEDNDSATKEPKDTIDTDDTKMTDIVVESSPKTIEDSPENIIDSDEAKSMESLTAEDNDSATKEPKDTIDTDDTKMTDIVVESPPKTIEDSPENIIDSDEPKSMKSLTAEDNDCATKQPKDTIYTEDTKMTDIVVESPSKTIEDRSENMINSDEAKSMESLTAEDNDSATKEPKDTIDTVNSNDDKRELSKIETTNLEINDGKHSSQPAVNNIKIVIEPLTSEDSKSPEETTNITGQNVLLSETLILDTVKPQVEEKVSEKGAVENSSYFDRPNNSNEIASIKDNSSEPKDFVKTKESSKALEIVTEPAESTEDTIIEFDEATDSGKNTESLESMIKDLQSDLGMNENLEATAVNN